MEGKKALLAVSFGTSHRDTLEKTIAAAERDLAAAFPERKLYRAFTSGMILRKLAREDGLQIDDVPSALARLAEEGYTDVLVQPTHIINGDEYDKLRALAAGQAGRFQRVAFGVPLLTEPEDYQACVSALLAELPPEEEGRAVVLMGHGTGHPANAAYALLEYVLHDWGRRDVLVGTVEGWPGLEEVLRRLAERPAVRRVELRPLMLVAGDHAKHDLAGDGEDSWKSRLEGAGYETSCVLRGLGEYPGIRALFVEHARRAAQSA